MIERLHRALEHIEELSPEVQEDLARQIEDMTTPPAQESPQVSRDEALPPSVQRALELGGAWSDLQFADEFAFFDHTRKAGLRCSGNSSRICAI